MVLKTRTVLFVDQTPGGELAGRLKALYLGLESTMGFKIKVVERTGKTLRSSFPLTTLWDGLECGRTKCIPCHQGAEEIQPCTRQNIVYENICLECNPLAKNKGGLEDYKPEKPSLYIGESSRSLQERMVEHWASFKSKSEGSHIFKHQENHHQGATQPKFICKVVSFHRSALTRQVAEAVRIRRRGGEGGS